MDRFESMSAFVAVVEAGGFAAASRHIGTPLPSLSRKVSDLEDQLGTKLLVRSARKIALTESGRQFFEDARRILDNLGEAERVASAEYRAPRGELVVTAPIVLGRLEVVPVVADFLKSYPDVEVEMRLTDRRLNFGEQGVDVGVRIGELPDSSQIAARVGQVRWVVCAQPYYLAQRGTPREPGELTNHDCVTLAGPESAEWMFETGAVEVASRFKVSTAEAALEAGMAGAGIIRVRCYHAARAIAAGRLVALLSEYEPKPYPVSVVYPAGRAVPLKLRAFLDFAVPRLRARLQTPLS